MDGPFATRLVYRGLTLCALAAFFGCAATSDRPRPEAVPPAVSQASTPRSPPLPEPTAASSVLSPPYSVLRTQYSEPQPDPADDLTASGELRIDALVRAVLDSNPSLAAMVEAWRAAAQRYPQMISLEDPMLEVMRGTNEGWMIQASQKLPWPGKRQLRGNVAAAEAEMAGYDVDDTRLRLTEAAKMAFFDYYQAERLLTVNRAAAKLMREFYDIAKALYEASKATDQDVLQAGVDLADLEAREAELLRERKVAAARINTLLHRAVDHSLPPSPAEAAIPESPPAAETLIELALRQRPDLAAQEARIDADQSALALACKEFYPDFEVAAKYDAFMPPEMRSQVGMSLNVPLYRQRRHAAVEEASARLRQRRQELEKLRDEARFEVQSASQRLAERRQVVGLYKDKILPAAKANVESARIKYTNAQLDFLRLIEAQRQYQIQQDRYYMAVADYHRIAAELERAVGGRLPLRSEIGG